MLIGGSDITVIIRARNEERYIGYAIQSVIDFLPRAKMVIVDNESTDETRDIVRSFLGRIEFQLIQVSDYTPGKALNLGVDAADTTFIMVLSAHCQLTVMNEGPIKACVTSHGACFGKQVPIWRGKKVSPRYIWSHFGDQRVENMHSQIEDRPFFHNALSFFTRECLIRQRFDEDLCGKEDRYWAAARIAGGKKYIYNPEFVCLHHWTPNGNTWKGVG